MFNTIVLGLDGSEESKRAFPSARELASRSGGRIIAVHVRELLVGRAGGQTLHVNEDEIEAGVRATVEEFGRAGADIQLMVVPVVAGGPAHVLAGVAREENADVIVVGTRGNGQLMGLLLGSVTHRLLHIAPCAVLAVPGTSVEEHGLQVGETAAAVR
jgi:nucleotide-binding universal stress UspA family protein